jgi:hypothetical protein
VSCWTSSRRLGIPEPPSTARRSAKPPSSATRAGTTDREPRRHEILSPSPHLRFGRRSGRRFRGSIPVHRASNACNAVRTNERFGARKYLTLRGSRRGQSASTSSAARPTRALPARRPTAHWSTHGAKWKCSAPIGAAHPQIANGKALNYEDMERFHGRPDAARQIDNPRRYRLFSTATVVSFRGIHDG